MGWKDWKNRVAAAVMAVGLLACSSVSHAMGELENVTLDVFVNPVGAPMGFIEDSVNRPQGIDVDIVYELQRRLLFTLRENRIFPLDRDAAFQRLEHGTADLVVGGISYTKERAKKYDFTPIYFRSCLVVVYSKRHHPEIKNMFDLKGLKVGYKRGSPTLNFVEQTGGKGAPFDDNLMALFQVSDGQLDALIYDRPPMVDFVRTMDSLDLAVTNDVFGDEASCFAFALPKDSRYGFLISETLETMLADGTIDAILKKWHAEKVEDLRKNQQQITGL